MVQRKPSYTDHEGFLMPMGFPLEAFRSALQYTARPSDIFICAYPKCGTTWLQYIVYLILHEGKALPASGSMTKEIPHLEEVGKAALFLASPLSSGITGAILPVDAGYHITGV